MVKGKKSINKTTDEEKWYILHNIELEKQLSRLQKQVNCLRSAVELKEAINSFQKRMMDIMDGALQLIEDGRLCAEGAAIFAEQTLKQVRHANIGGDLQTAYDKVNKLLEERG